MKKWTQDELNKLYAQVQQKASTDKEFRDELLKDATAAIEKLAGEKLPEDYKIKAVEQDPNYSATFVIPDLISEELNEEELQGMAGGLGINSGCPDYHPGCFANACVDANCPTAAGNCFRYA